MIVFSPLSLYTTYLGWQQYDVIFDALWQTGIIFLGFLMIAYRYLKNMLVPSGPSAHASEQALHLFLYELAVLFFICAVFVYPCVPLVQKGISFKPMCTTNKGGSDGAVKSSIKDSGTTYDEAFADVLTDRVKIPIGFSFVQDMASGFTYGLMKVTGCSDSLHAIQGDLISTYIPHDLRQHAVQFHRQCFLEARSSYMKEQHTDAEKAALKAQIKAHGGEDDLNWMGSKTFRELYYKKLKAREPVEGFSYARYPNPKFESAATEDTEVSAHKPTNGYPTCAQWWDKIQTELVQVSEKASYFDKHLGKLNVESRMMDYKIKHKNAWRSDLTAQDYIAKVLIQDNRDLQEKSTEALMDPSNGTVGTFLSRNLVNLGQSVKSYTSTPLKREATMQTLPVMQALFYFFLIVFTPIVLALSGMSPRALGTLIGLYTMGIFVQCIWHYVSFLERGVIDPLGDSDSVAAMRNMVVLFYYIGPIIFLKLSGHFGGDAGAGLMSLLDESNTHSEKVSQSGTAAFKAGAKIATKGAM
jgi:hypothetical protein